MNEGVLAVQVVYAVPDAQAVVDLTLPAGSTVADALAAACAGSTTLAALDLDRFAVGIFGEHVEREQALAAGDRVEIYRPLLADPKAARRARAEKQRNG